MALVVEDGTGLLNSESYVTVDDFKEYHKARGNSVTLGGSQIEQRLRLATEYIDLRWGDKAGGEVVTEDQALVWPRDCDEADPASLPRDLKNATMEYGFFAIENDLFINNDSSSGPGIMRLLEKVGPIETDTTYSGSGLGSPSRKYPIVSKADALMRKLTRSGQGGVYR